MAQVKIKLLDHFDKELPLPNYKTSGAAGADVCACLTNETLTIAPFERVLIPTGLSFEIEPGFEVQVRPRSGLSLSTNLMVINSPGTIDSDYRGEVKVILGNIGPNSITIRHGDRIAQLVVAPVTRAKFLVIDELSKTIRGEGGFGSTGISK